MKLRLLLLLCLIAQHISAQILNVSHPLRGAVYQRNANNKAVIRVIGTYNARTMINGDTDLDVSLRRLRVKEGTPTGSAIIPIPMQQSGVCFQGEAEVEAGWYEITVIATNNYEAPNRPNRTRAQSLKYRVGVGDVYLIAGQSNAQGLPNDVASGTESWDGVRVSPRRFQEAEFSISDPKVLPNNKQMFISNMVSAQSNSSFIGPTGNSLWYWALVGQQLAQLSDVPIAFHNVAWGGTTITQWAASTNNTKSPLADKVFDPSFPGGWVRFGTGAPFGLLGNAVKYYSSIYGLKAILWMQGETDTRAIVSNWGKLDDNLENQWQVFSAPDYANRLNIVINATRQKIQNLSIPWVVSSTSYYTGSESAFVTGGQSAVVNASNKVYGGPSTDDIKDSNEAINSNNTVYRRTGAGEPVHFKGLGLVAVGNRWFEAIRDNGSLSSPAITPQQLGTLPVCADVLTGVIRAPQAQSYQWVRDDGDFADLNDPVNFTQEISTSLSGQRRGVLRNSQGNYILTQAVNLPFSVVDNTQYPEDPTPPSTSSQCKNGNENSGGNRTPNGATVGGFGNSNEFMEYTFTGQTAGNTTFSIRYASGDGTAGIDLVVNGTPYSMRPAGTASWTPSIEASRTINLVQGTNTIRIQGSEQGNFTFDRICLGGSSGGSPTPPPPSGGGGGSSSGLSIASVNLNCGTGTVTMNFNGSNGNAIEYRAPGLQDWSTNQLVIPSWQRNNTGFTFFARQASNNETNTNYTTNCGGGRVATQAEDATDGFWVSPNPTSGQVVARFTLTEGQCATLSVVNTAGQALQSRGVVGTGKAQRETLELGNQANGLYLIRLQTTSGTKAAKVMLQR